MLNKYNVFNRPISPHLTIYSSLGSSSFSIWHRFAALLLVFILFFLLINLKVISVVYPLVTLYIIDHSFIINNFQKWFLNFMISFLISIFFYHLLNGIRHIAWDLNLFLTNKKISISNIFLLIFLFFILFFNIVKF